MSWHTRKELAVRASCELGLGYPRNSNARPDCKPTRIFILLTYAPNTVSQMMGSHSPHDGKEANQD